MGSRSDNSSHSDVTLPVSPNYSLDLDTFVRSTSQEILPVCILILLEILTICNSHKQQSLPIPNVYTQNPYSRVTAMEHELLKLKNENNYMATNIQVMR